jgi:tryptophanyl-tRNA synthetase
LYEANFVPVGKDQLQHLEMSRDSAKSFNHQYGETFVVPEPKIQEEVMIVPGIDGQKMSKSLNNFINIFLPEKELKKVVMSIVTDDKALEAPKDPDTCNVFALYKLLATGEQAEQMKKNYVTGNYGYGHAKTAFLDLILLKFADAREKYFELMNNPALLEAELSKGAQKARKINQPVLKRVREKLGY